jgi:hypothetical protein
MARRKNSPNGFLSSVAEASPSYSTLFVILFFFLLSGALFSVLAGIPWVGGALFALGNLAIIFFGGIFVFLTEIASSRSFGKSAFAWLLYFVFMVLPFNFVWPIALIVLKALTKK